MTIPPTRFVESNGIRLAYDSFGDSGATPILLIMGLGAQMIAWDEDYCEQLAARGYQVFRFDNRDIGQSTHFSHAGLPMIGALMVRAMAGQAIESAAPYTLADMSADVVGLMDSLGLQSAHLVGASMGGAIAQETALRYPDRVRTLVSIMATSGAPGLPPPTPAAMSALMVPLPVDRAGYIDRHIQIMKALRGGAAAEEEPEDAERARRSFDRGIDPDGFTRQLAAILASGSRRERLASLQTPTLVIHGDLDPLVPIECGKDVMRAVPGAKMLTVRGMGHTLPRSAWPEVINAIAEHAK